MTVPFGVRQLNGIDNLLYCEILLIPACLLYTSGFGITYIGKDITLNIRVAIKEYYPSAYVNRNSTISPEVLVSQSNDRENFYESGKRRFLDEARNLAMFSNEPGIVNVRDYFEENNSVYIVMEYIDGETLKDYLCLLYTSRCV